MTDTKPSVDFEEVNRSLLHLRDLFPSFESATKGLLALSEQMSKAGFTAGDFAKIGNFHAWRLAEPDSSGLSDHRHRRMPAMGSGTTLNESPAVRMDAQARQRWLPDRK